MQKSLYDWTTPTRTLLLDVGHTRLKWALIGPEGHFDPQAVAYDKDDFLKILDDIKGAILAPEKIALANVANPCFSHFIQQWSKQHWPQALFQECKSVAQAYGVTVAYQNPETLGADRFLGLIAARHYYPNQTVILLSAGTCVTVDVLNASGQHEGGWIMPGFVSMQQFLKQQGLANRAELAPTAILSVAPILGHSTAECVEQGMILQYQALSCALSEYIHNKNPDQVILTGGDADLLLATGQLPTHISMHSESYWVMRGLYVFNDLKVS